MKQSNRILINIWVLTSLMVFPGCATLTIDVDVYKGPLANHEQVQTEQIAAMGMGAKPLLVQLRNRLEEDYLTRKKNIGGCPR